LVLSMSTWCTGLALDMGFAPQRIVIILALLFLLPGTAWFSYLTFFVKKVSGKDV
ncbi:MAG: MFS transporter, partial [Desulfobulbus sp.]